MLRRLCWGHHRPLTLRNVGHLSWQLQWRCWLPPGRWIRSVDHSDRRFLGSTPCCEPHSRTSRPSILKELMRPRRFSAFHHFLYRGRKEQEQCRDWSHLESSNQTQSPSSHPSHLVCHWENSGEACEWSLNCSTSPFLQLGNHCSKHGPQFHSSRNFRLEGARN